MITKYYLTFIFSFLTLISFDALFQTVFETNLFFIPKISETITAGFFGDEKKLGRFLVVILSFTIGLVLLHTKNKKNIFYFFILAFLINYLVIFTSERVAMIYGYVVIVTFIILLRHIYGKKILYLFLLPILAIFLSYNFSINLFNDKIIDSINQIFEKKTKIYFFSKSHENYADTSIKLFKSKPIFGIGPKNFRKNCNTITPKYKEVKNCSTHPHNIFIQIFVEAGIFSGLIYLFFIYKLIEIIFKSIFLKKNLNEASLVFFILPVFFYLNPFLPSGNLFNNWNMMIGIFTLPFYLYYKKNYEIKK